MKQTRRQNELQGGLLMILAMTILPVSDALSKYLVQTYSAEQITLARNLVHSALGVILLLATGRLRDLVVREKKLHALRAVCFVTMTASFVASLQTLPLADALGIVFLFPALIVLLSALWLREQTTRWQWSAVLLGFCGIWLIVEPTGGVSAGAWLALVAAIATALYNLLTRRLADTGSSLALTVIPALGGTCLLLPVAAPSLVMPDLNGAVLMVVVGLLAATVHGLLVLAYQKSTASQIAPLAYVQIAVAVVMGYLLFGDWPRFESWIGLTLVIGSGVLVLWKTPA